MRVLKNDFARYNISDYEEADDIIGKSWAQFPAKMFAFVYLLLLLLLVLLFCLHDTYK